ncbi:hypothetical protein ACN23B_23445 [Anabaena sp. FACHB-709]|uniref:Transposase n=1 Tax=Anabaena cylindrica FACHB-318 TaxID=2692880 RepID=A0ABR7ZM63_ANACY|nr:MULTISPECIES: hypothetical protein [Nostocaceae]HBW30671.1 hypothetical protein [Nostoc sp. UBA8866]MBD2173450.1 hypothetical protein [Anabaena cylindrica FACHB-318]MBD2265241.1 hypothetical protein [Anabaena sp. FACHB-709]MBD2274511.1 hypothetical protein [Nostoc sp. PCC 7120 = FACHB-418]MBD2285442.1 hypothetical protein [Anabaena cylindrica FACHB-170]
MMVVVGNAKRHLLQAGKPFQQLLHLGKPQDRTASPTQWLSYVYFRNQILVLYQLSVGKLITHQL